MTNDMKDAIEFRKPSVVYIQDGCEISENETEIIITEPNGKKHSFPKGSYVFSQRHMVDANNWGEE